MKRQGERKAAPRRSTGGGFSRHSVVVRAAVGYLVRPPQQAPISPLPPPPLQERPWSEKVPQRTVLAPAVAVALAGAGLFTIVPLAPTSIAVAVMATVAVVAAVAIATRGGAVASAATVVAMVAAAITAMVAIAITSVAAVVAAAVVAALAGAVPAPVGSRPCHCQRDGASIHRGWGVRPGARAGKVAKAVTFFDSS
jgi:hypothetical protein